MHASSKQSKHRPAAHGQGSWLVYVIIFVVMSSCGYGIGYLTKGMMFTSPGAGTATANSPATTSPATQATTTDTTQTAATTTATTHKGVKAEEIIRPTVKQPTAKQTVNPNVKHKWAGDTIHSVMTSSGDPYQNFQGRIMYATYKLVQKMPGGERLTGFTRLLHRTVPDVLMDEMPTYHVFPHKPQCDGWCDYPVANRPHAIKAYFDAVALNESMIQGAWVFMLECDYVWMQPMKVPGSAWDPTVPSIQFWYDYIIPGHANAVPSMKKLYNGPVSDIPASGPAPVLMRVDDWQVVVKDYVRLSEQMEADEAMKKALEWVREMYAWDAALAHHREIKVVTEHPPNSTTIVQPPFDEQLGEAALCHYTWGALYHEGLPSKGGKQVYRWEKRDFNDQKFVLKVPNIPMPPEFKPGWILEFDAPLTRKRHNLVVLMLTQMNKAIDLLPDLTQHWAEFQPKLKQLEIQRDIKLGQMKAAAAAAQGKASSRRLLQS